MLKQRGKAQTQHLKNMERMKAEINKRIEQLLQDIINILDTHSQTHIIKKTYDGRDNHQQIISTDTILKGSVIQSEEDIDEQIKAKFLARLVREYRKNRERAK